MNAKRSAHPGEAKERPLVWPGDPESLTAEAVDFEALAHVLANTCRRDGRLRRFHSLAAHAVTMSEAIEDLGGDVREAALHALLFEASVAWLGPDAAPSRRSTPQLRRLGGKIDRAVREAAGLGTKPASAHAELVHFVARMAESAEVRDVPGASGNAAPAVAFPPLDRRIRPIDPARAARLWLDRFNDLRKNPDTGGSVAASAPEKSQAKNHPTLEEQGDDAHMQTAQEAPRSSVSQGSRDAA